MAEPLYVGVDRSDGGWVAVAFTGEGFDHASVFGGIGECWAAYEERARRMLVGVPIGLVESGEPDRRCDDLARSVLGERSTSIPTPPVREATRKQRYSTANRVHKRKSGQELSEAAFALSDSLARVDELLQELPEAAAVIRESHPEVCFRAFAGESLSHPKRTAGGYAERMRVLAHYDRDAAPTVQKAAQAMSDSAVTVDDVLDAVALAYTAQPGDGELYTLPSEPPRDATGLPMEIVYRAASPLGEQ
jgi:predicted RNase H-like nuclease